MSNHAYMFSVVVPVYQVGAYLDETILSVVAQTIGFEKHVQLVLVNDGSTDDSESICLRYAERYPDNVTYIRQDNAGVSAARNKGMEFVRGEYVNFLDGDDKWEVDAFERVAAFFVKHPQIEVVGAQLVFFGANTGGHPLNYRFEGDRVIDITEEPNAPQLSVAAAFIRRSALEGRSFDPRLKISEDFRLLAPMIVENGSYGVMESVVYQYRRRDALDSAINTATRARTWYFDTPQFCYRELFEYSRDKFGCVVPYIQHCVMYDLQWRLRAKLSADLSVEDVARYRGLIAGLIADVDDDIIYAQCRRNVDQMLYAFALKEGVSVADLRHSLRVERGGVFHRDLKIRNLARQQKIVIEILEFEGDSLRVEGYVDSVLESSALTVGFNARGNHIDATLIERPERRLLALGEVIRDSLGFVAVIPLGESQTVAAVLRLRDFKMAPTLAFGAQARLTWTMKTSYFTDDGWFASVSQKLNGIRVRRDRRPFAVLRREWRYLRELVSVEGRKDLAWYRVLYFLLKPLLLGRRVWVISDRISRGGDNGEAFFRYLRKARPSLVLPYFALSRDSADYVDLERVGKVVSHDSFKYRLLMLLADAVVSSGADDHTTSPFGVDDKYMKNLYAFKFTFLQHGISKDDMSSWLNKYKKNIRIFVTASMAERNSILQGNYYYDSKVVKLTGLPRNDSLWKGDLPAENKIIMMPTWRKALTASQDRTTGLRKPFPGFSETEYFRFYNSLINDSRLLEAMADAGYAAKFITHPSMAQEVGVFEGNELVTVQSTCDYQHEYKTAKLMVTDFSSVAFDFASLGKPVIYAQFDRDFFYQGQVYTAGYFEYERDGFGPVCNDYEQTVAAILAALSADCEMNELYRDRAAAFFYKGEIPACEAVYRAILEA